MKLPLLLIIHLIEKWIFNSWPAVKCFSKKFSYTFILSLSRSLPRSLTIFRSLFLTLCSISPKSFAIGLIVIKYESTTSNFKMWKKSLEFITNGMNLNWWYEIKEQMNAPFLQFNILNSSLFLSTFNQSHGI